MASGSKKVIILALCANLGIAISKLTGALISKSASLMAESIHSFVDCSNQGILLLGAKLSSKSPDEKHPLGYGREAFFWSFIVAILLFSLGGMFAIYEGIHKLSEHSELGSPLLGIIILVISIGLEAYSCWACIKEVQLNNPFGSLWAWFKNTTSSDLLVIFTEDLAAMAGLVIALMATLLAYWTGDPRWDAGGSIVVGIVLVLVAILLGWEIKSLLVGEAPSTNFRAELEKLLSENFVDAKILNLIVLQTGNSEVMLSCKFFPGTEKDVKQLITKINQLEVQLKKLRPEIKWLFFEPDFVN